MKLIMRRLHHDWLKVSFESLIKILTLDEVLLLHVLVLQLTEHLEQPLHTGRVAFPLVESSFRRGSGGNNLGRGAGVNDFHLVGRRPRTHQIVVIRIFQNITCFKFIVFGESCQIYYKLARFWMIFKSLTITENDNLKS